MSGSRELKNLQLLRAVAILLVAAMHIEQPFVRSMQHPAYAEWLRYVGFSGVDQFFVLSGFINYYISERRMGGWRYTLQFWLRRAIRIMPVYWLILTFTLGLVIIYDFTDLTHKNLFASYFPLWPVNLAEHILSPAWTLSYELGFYLALGLLMLVPRLLWPMAFFYAAIIALAQLELDYTNAAMFYAFSLSPFFLQFIAGMMIGWVARRGVMPLPIPALLFGLWMGALAIYIGSVIYPEGFTNPFHRDLRAVLYVFTYAPVVYALVALERSGRWQCGFRPLLAIGDASYSIYLLMMPFYYIYHWGIMALIPPPYSLGFILLIYMPMGFISLMVLGIYFSKNIEFPMIKWLNSFIKTSRSAR